MSIYEFDGQIFAMVKQMAVEKIASQTRNQEHDWLQSEAHKCRDQCATHKMTCSSSDVKRQSSDAFTHLHTCLIQFSFAYNSGAIIFGGILILASESESFCYR